MTVNIPTLWVASRDNSKWFCFLRIGTIVRSVVLSRALLMQDGVCLSRSICADLPVPGSFFLRIGTSVRSRIIISSSVLIS
jgi:hypothetical protein